MNRKAIFDRVRAMLGRGFKTSEVTALDAAIDAAMKETGDQLAVESTGRRTNQAGVDLIKTFEGLRTRPYLCPANVWTVGYGHTGPDVKPGLAITEAEAEALLRADLARFEKAVATSCPKATDNQFSAMVALAFNIGEAAFPKSSVARFHNAGNYASAADSFLLWSKATVGGKKVVLKGLVRRREAEKALYLS